MNNLKELNMRTFLACFFALSLAFAMVGCNDPCEVRETCPEGGCNVECCKDGCCDKCCCDKECCKDGKCCDNCQCENCPGCDNN